MAAITKRLEAYRDTAARARLADARGKLAAVRADMQAAEAAHDEAVRQYRAAQSAVEDIQDRIDGLARQYRQAHPMGREDIQRRVDECQQPLREAKAPLMALARIEEAAEARAKEISGRISFYESAVREAAAGVVRAEAPQVAEALIPALREAFATILTAGPDVLWLIESDMVGRDIIDALGDGPRKMLNPLQSWPDFERRYRTSPWRGAVPALEADPDAALLMTRER